MFIVIFTLVYVTMSEVDPGAFDEPVTRIAGLYFTVTVFTTVGFGDIVARTDAARAVVTVQMLLDLVILGGLVRVVIGASQLALMRRRSEANQPGGEPTSARVCQACDQALSPCRPTCPQAGQASSRT